MRIIIISRYSEKHDKYQLFGAFTQTLLAAKAIKKDRKGKRFVEVPMARKTKRVPIKGTKAPEISKAINDALRLNNDNAVIVDGADWPIYYVIRTDTNTPRGEK